MSSNTFLIDAASRRAAFLQRYSAGVERSAAQYVEDIIDQLLARFLLEYDSDLSGARLGSLSLDISAQGQNLYEDFYTEIINEVVAFSENEVEFSVEMLSRASSAEISPPDIDAVRSRVFMSPIDVAPGQQMTISRSVSQFGKKKVAQIKRIIEDGFLDGKTSGELTKAIKDIVPLQRNQAASLVRTATNSASTLARFEVLLGNLDIFTGYEWVSTLDNRTSNICMARDGIIYKFEVASPLPPAHWGCRSTIIPKINPKYDLGSSVKGDRPSVGPDGAEQVSGQTTYGGWLRRQPASFQDEALGPTRAKLFRNGGLSLDAFVDPTGRTYTLEQLRSLNPLAFEQANIN